MFLEQVIFRCTKELTVLYYGHVEHDIFTGIQLKKKNVTFGHA